MRLAWPWRVPGVALLVVGAVCTCAWAGGRRTVEVRESAADGALRPAAAAAEASYAPVLSGLDFTAIAPPGVRLRVIEDEPYIYAQDASGNSPAEVTALCSLALHAGLEGDKWYEARINLRSVPLTAEAELQSSFDAAANDMYGGSMVESELRTRNLYNLYEVRSPLGLTDGHDETNRWREYLGYTAMVAEPLLTVPAEQSAQHVQVSQPTPSSAPDTPYSAIKGELRMLRRAGRHCFMLTISFEGGRFPYCLGLTENLARCTINRILALSGERTENWLQYLVYYPEREPLMLAAGETADMRVADLAEQPGDGCGVNAVPITGDICPECEGAGLFWPARPYADQSNRHKLRQRALQATCSHCLMPAFDTTAGPRGETGFLDAVSVLNGVGTATDARSCLRGRSQPCWSSSASCVNKALQAACRSLQHNY